MHTVKICLTQQGTGHIEVDGVRLHRVMALKIEVAAETTLPLVTLTLAPDSIEFEGVADDVRIVKT